MDLTKSQSIAGKYFINSIAAGMGMQALIKGRVVGPISELLPLYLCDVYPVDDTQIAVTAQTILSAEQLIGVYFYDDKPLFDAAWVQMQKTLDAQRKQAERAEQARRRSNARQIAQALKDRGIQIVSANEPAELAAMLAAEAAETDEADDAAGQDDED